VTKLAVCYGCIQHWVVSCLCYKNVVMAAYSTGLSAVCYKNVVMAAYSTGLSAVCDIKMWLWLHTALGCQLSVL
jgi:hypothetical protein